eukprot:s148_g33.t1
MKLLDAFARSAQENRALYLWWAVQRHFHVHFHDGFSLMRSGILCILGLFRLSKGDWDACDGFRDFTVHEEGALQPPCVARCENEAVEQVCVRAEGPSQMSFDVHFPLEGNLSPWDDDPGQLTVMADQFGAYGPSLRGGEYADRAVVETIISAGGVLSKSESMEITNDPRSDLEQTTTAVVLGLAPVSEDNLFAMNKTMHFSKKHDHMDSCCQLAAMCLLSVVHYLNIIATYVGVAQPYHTIRLMTAGPTGFESAACYYLNKNIIAWRHFAVFGALFSMPLFLASSGLRMIVKFDRDPWPTRNAAFLKDPFEIFSALRRYIHNKHWKVFDERYRLLKPNLMQHHAVLDTMTSRRAHLQA